MQSAGAAIMLDCCTVFWRMLRITGWFSHPIRQLLSVEIVANEKRAGTVSEVAIPHAGVEQALGKNKGFALEILFQETVPDPLTLGIAFTLDDGSRIKLPLASLVNERISKEPPNDLFARFHEWLQKHPQADVLDVGGRARSGRDRSTELPGKKATVLDVLEAPNVDVVGDAHKLSTYFPRNSFDGFMSVAVFEHLAMPWKVAVELNRVLKNDGIGFALSHQALGMHDMPWDFWRYSDQAWRSIFNEHTGFQVLGTALGGESYLIPHFWRPDKHEAEKAVGFELSAVLVKKIGEAKLDWDISTEDFLDTHYPGGNDSLSLHPVAY